MTTEVATRDLAERRRSLLAYSVGLAVYILVVVAIYPAFKDTTSLDKLTTENPGLAAVFGISGSITSSVGWMSANVYANFFPLVALLVTIGYGAHCLAGQEESGHLELILSLPFARHAVVVQKIAALITQATVLGVVVFGAAACGRFFEMDFSLGALVASTAGVALMAIDLGLLAMALGAWRGNRAMAIGIAAAVAAASYLVSSLAPVVSALEPFRFASLFYWCVGQNQLENGLDAASVAVLVGTGAVLVIASVVLFEHHDLRA